MCAYMDVYVYMFYIHIFDGKYGVLYKVASYENCGLFNHFNTHSYFWIKVNLNCSVNSNTYGYKECLRALQLTTQMLSCGFIP